MDNCDDYDDVELVMVMVEQNILSAPHLMNIDDQYFG